MSLTPAHAEHRSDPCEGSTRAWFRDLSPMALAEYEAMEKQVFLPDGSILFRQDEEPRSVFLLCRGAVKLTKTSRQGKTFLIRIAKPGDLLGLSSDLATTQYLARA